MFPSSNPVRAKKWAAELREARSGNLFLALVLFVPHSPTYETIAFKLLDPDGLRQEPP